MAPPTKTSIMLVTGEYFDYLDPNPSVINLDVLELGLGVPRFNNQTIRTITTLEHSLRVRRIVAELGGDDHAQLWALLHDAHEALMPWGDCLRPGKTQEMREAEALVDSAIITALRIPKVVACWDIVKTADAIALYFEAMLWQPGAVDWAPHAWPKTHEITGGGERPRPSRGELIERLMPLIVPCPGECWRIEVEALLRTSEQSADERKADQRKQLADKLIDTAGNIALPLIAKKLGIDPGELLNMSTPTKLGVGRSS